MSTNITNSIREIRGQISDYSRGQAALATTLLISGIMVEIGIGIALIAFLILNSGLGNRLSAEALVAAQAGLHDAFIKITRDKNFSSAGYDISVDSRSARVTVVVNSPSAGKDTVTSTGTAGARQRRLQAILVIASTTGKVNLESIAETAL